MLEFLEAWANVPYVIALTATLLYALLQGSGIVGLLAGGGDVDADVDVDVDVDVDADADVDADVDADADADSDADGARGGGGHAGPGLALTLLSPLGLGRVPITWTAQVVGFSFGALGVLANAGYELAIGVPPTLTLLATLPLATLGSYGVGALFARVMAPITDDRRYAATTRHALIGGIGTVISSRVSLDALLPSTRVRVGSADTTEDRAANVRRARSQHRSQS